MHRILTILLLFPLSMLGQSTFIPLGNEAYHTVDRLEIRSGEMAPFYTVHKPYDRKDVTHFTIDMDQSGLFKGLRDSADMYYIFKDNNDWLKVDVEKIEEEEELSDLKKVYIDSTKTFYYLKPIEKNKAAFGSWEKRYVKSKKPIFKHFYRTPANLIELDKDHFNLRVNPVLHWKVGKEQDDEGIVFQNTRGVEIRGNVDDRVWFHTEIVENQARFPIHVTDRALTFQAVPGAGFYKPYNSSFLNYDDDFDFLNAQGYIAARITKHIQVKFGHGRHFIGDGHRSLFLSDNSANYFYLQLNTRVWKFNYQNLFTELTKQYDRSTNNDRLLPKKYMAAHHLNFNAFKNFNIGIFEATIFDRGNTFELQYLNPIILYRTVEQAIGSSDNAIIGLNAKYNFLKHFSIYGQFILDEFVFSELVKGDGWWANKYGLQLGAKYIDAFGIDHLDFQAEYNTVRPYTYTHRDFDANYTHYNQALAHPLGANFTEAIAIVRYQPIPKLQLMGKIVYARYGTDSLGTNYGGNIFLDHRTREMDYGNKTGQGVGNTMLQGSFLASYRIRHNIYADIDFRYRALNSDDNSADYTRAYLGFGIRYNIANRVDDY